jgi:tetratricopeptide (TPR) repeat protein
MERAPMQFAFRLSLALVVLVVARPAHADKTDEARQHYRQATAVFALGRYGDAAKEYETAFELLPDAALLYDAAKAHRLAGNKRRALQLFTSYLQVYHGEAGERATVEQQIDALKAELAHDKATPPQPDAPIAPPPSSVVPAATTTPAVAPLVVAAPPAEHDRRPRRRWLWGVGVSAGVVAGGIALTLGLIYGQHDPHANMGAVSY